MAETSGSAKGRAKGKGRFSSWGALVRLDPPRRFIRRPTTALARRPVEAMEGEAGFRARTSPPNGPASAPSLAASAASAGTLNGADHSYTASETLPRSQPLPSNGHAISCSIGHATRLLKREDTKDIREDVALNGRLYTFAAVFDGHGGAQAAEFCAQHMISYIEQAAQASPSPEGQIRDLISASQVCAARYE